jgi:hypothetical protein
MHDVLAEVRKEQERLRRQREAIDTRLAELDTVLRVLPTLGSQQTLAVLEVAEASDTLAATATTIKDRIADNCERLLSDRRPRHTRELVSYLRGEGIELKGKDPVLQVSSVLSKDGRFKANRSLGWTLVAQNDEGSDAGTTEPSDSRLLPLVAVPRQPSHP